MNLTSHHWCGQEVQPGTAVDLRLPLTQGVSGHDLNLPMHVWRGPAEGPTVLISAALHGDEINGTGAIRELILHPGFELKRGTLVLVPVLNLLGFERHSRYLPDRRDLNRSFPGNESGSMASRLAHRLFHELVMRCDLGIDLHSAAVRRTNYPNIRADLANPKVRELALAFGSEILVDSAGPAGSMRRAACDAGKPNILLEAGEVWKVEPTVVEIAHRGIRSVLAHLGMIEGKVWRPAFRVIARRTRWLRAEHGGFLRFHASPGDLVEEGQVLATNTSLLGREAGTIVSPMDGVIIGMTTLPTVAPGDPICHVARLRQDIDAIERKVQKLDEDSLHERLRADLGSSVTVEAPPSEPHQGH